MNASFLLLIEQLCIKQGDHSYTNTTSAWLTSSIMIALNSMQGSEPAPLTRLSRSPPADDKVQATTSAAFTTACLTPLLAL